MVRIVGSMMLMYALFFATVGYAFHPYYHHRWRQHHSYREVKLLDQQSFYYRQSQLSYAPTDPSIIEHNRQYLSDTLGFSEEKLDKIAAKQSGGNILTLDVDVLVERVSWLKNRLGLDDNQIKKVIQSQPTILNISLKSDMGLSPKIDWLQKRLILDQKSLAKMITKSPNILTMSIKDNIEPTLDWLQKRLLDLDDASLSKMIQKLPTILAYSIPNNMEPTLDWLQERLSLTDDELSKIIQTQPALFGYNIPNNLEPTLNFYIDALGDENEALALVTGDPHSFTYSLEKRLKPRLTQALDVGMVVDYSCVYHMMKCTNEQWSRKVEIKMGKR